VIITLAVISGLSTLLLGTLHFDLDLEGDHVAVFIPWVAMRMTRPEKAFPGNASAVIAAGWPTPRCRCRSRLTDARTKMLERSDTDHGGRAAARRC